MKALLASLLVFAVQTAPSFAALAPTYRLACEAKLAAVHVENTYAAESKVFSATLFGFSASKTVVDFEPYHLTAHLEFSSGGPVKLGMKPVTVTLEPTLVVVLEKDGRVKQELKRFALRDLRLATRPLKKALRVGESRTIDFVQGSETTAQLDYFCDLIRQE